MDAILPDVDENDEGEDEDEELALQLVSTNYELPAPKSLDSSQTNAFLRATMLRFVSSATNLQSPDAVMDNRHLTALARGPPPSEMWIFLFIRMVTRGQRDSSGMSSEGLKIEKANENSPMDISTDLKARNVFQDEIWARNDLLRGMILEYIMADLPSRCVTWN